ncbi:MAG: branched-chain amino acid ABC transporter permease [Candidatus Rokubacteria bacterium]|nr:branched-chain amino acid ABC transporter permease [Candidatus Rokubacteria bacterium]
MSRWGAVAVMAAVVVLLALPWGVREYNVQLANLFLIGALFALSFNILFGYTGLLSFGQATFFGVGAYALALLMKKAGLSFALAFVLSVPITALTAGVIGFFCSRATEFFFSILTLAFGQLLFVVASKWYTLTAGDDGIQSIFPPPALGSAARYYYFSLAVVTLSTAALWWIVRSPFGYTLQSIRDNPQRSEAIGINLRWYRWMAFVVSGVFAGVAGALFTAFNWAVAPTELEWTKSAEPVVMTLLGGPHLFGGPIVGAAIFTFFQFYLGKHTLFWALSMGVVILFVVRFMPGGVGGYLWQRVQAARDASGQGHAPRR